MIGALAVAAVAMVLGVPEPAPSAAATPKPALKEIGHVRALTPYCSAFERHFNAIVHPLLENDARVGSIDFTLGGIKTHFSDLRRESELYTDRLNLIAYVDQMHAAIPQLQAEIDALRVSGKLASDPIDAQLAHDVAAQLQKGLDKQKQIANDTGGVIEALTAMTATDPGGDSQDLAQQSLRPETTALQQLALIDASSHAFAAAISPKNDDDVRDYLHLQTQRDRIGDAEGAAAVMAAHAYDRCSS